MPKPAQQALQSRLRRPSADWVRSSRALSGQGPGENLVALLEGGIPPWPGPPENRSNFGGADGMAKAPPATSTEARSASPTTATQDFLRTTGEFLDVDIDDPP